MRQSCLLTGALFSAIVLLSAGCEIRDQPASPDLTQAEPPSSIDEAGTDKGPARGRMDFVDGYERGCQRARDEQKPMLIFFTARWCKYCHEMAQETFLQDAVVNLSRGFVCIQIDADAEPQACREFEVRSFPTIQFVSSTGVRLNRVVGKQPASQLMAQMRAALAALARRPRPTIQR